jgi:N-acetylmuramoyl-L-alanine amidase
VAPAPAAVPGVASAKPAHQPASTLTRALGLKLGRILIDAGHGGHDQGTSGPTGLLEKELVLDVALRLGALIEERLGAEVVYTRTTDVYLGLEERSAVANRQRADLFLSIHANSSGYKDISGAETFYLHFTGSRAELETAARENAGTTHNVYELRELAQKIALADKRDESIRLANQIQGSLAKAWGQANEASRNRGVKRAPFVVLIGTGMPAVLTEIGFVSNPGDERLMKSAEFRDKLAASLLEGISTYAGTLSQASKPATRREGSRQPRSGGAATARVR